MATKPLLPEVVAERAQATRDYHNAQQAAIDRIAVLRAARLKQEADRRKKDARKDTNKDTSRRARRAS